MGEYRIGFDPDGDSITIKDLFIRTRGGRMHQYRKMGEEAEFDYVGEVPFMSFVKGSDAIFVQKKPREFIDGDGI